MIDGISGGVCLDLAHDNQSGDPGVQAFPPLEVAGRTPLEVPEVLVVAFSVVARGLVVQIGFLLVRSVGQRVVPAASGLQPSCLREGERMGWDKVGLGL